MRFIAIDFVPPTGRAGALLYAATEALRLADLKLTDTIDNLDLEPYLSLRKENARGCMELGYGDGTCGLDFTELDDARRTVRFCALVLQEVCAGPPAVPETVFPAIRAWENWSYALNPPHVQAASLAMKLAIHCLEEVEKILCDADVLDEDAVTLTVAVIQATKQHDSILSGLIDDSCLDDVLTLLLAGKAVPGPGDEPAQERLKRKTLRRLVAEVEALR